MRTIEIAPRTIIFTVFFLIGLYVLWTVRELIYSLFIAFILMSALRPIVRRLEHRNIPHKIAVTFVYLIFLFVFIFLISLIIPPIVIETLNLIHNLPAIVERFNIRNATWLQLDNITQYLPTATNQVLEIASTIFSNTFFVITTLFFGFYFLLENNLVEKILSQFFNKKQIVMIHGIFAKTARRMSSWFWGELVLMSLVGVLSYVGFLIIGIKYELPLAVLAGILEVVPNIGPIISGLLAAIIGFSVSPALGFSTITLAVIIQQLENNLIVPIVMSRAVGLSPIITLMSLIIGGKLGGVLGVLLAIPLYLFFETLYIELIRDNQLEEIMK